MVEETKKTSIDLGLLVNSSIERQPDLTAGSEVADTRGNHPPPIVITQAQTTENAQNEHDSERRSVIQDLGKKLRSEHSGRSAAHTNVQQSGYDSSNDHQTRPGRGHEPEKIEKLLRARSIQTPDELDGRSFVPSDAQEEILTHRLVEEELRRINLEEEELHDVVNYVCSRNKTGRQIFAILTLIGKQESIGAFKEAGIFDDNLPFKQWEPTIHDRYQLIPYGFADDRNLGSLGCSKDWGNNHKDQFFTYQWRFLSPFFGRNPENKASFYPFANNIIIPWTDCTPYVDESGGNSEVRMVTIHEAHHGFEEERGKPFALKTLRSRNPEDFETEFRALQKVRTHQHLVPVLAAFNYRGSYYFLFPWADGGNLDKVWRQNQEAITPKPTLWVAQQCYGLATALLHIHDISRDTSSLVHDNNTLAIPESPKQPYGRHGDIKPENVLLFKDGGSKMGTGNLKISDFGLTKFHNQESRSTDRIAYAALSYNPPETTDPTSNISRKFDIWCLGCLYLNFLTWLFAGFQGVDKFNNARYHERMADPKHKFDFFFKDVERNGRKTLVVKDSVKKHIHKLQTREDCSDFLFEFLEIIKNQMLVVDVNKRITCEELEKTLKGMVEERHDDYYLLRRLPKPADEKPRMLHLTSLQVLIIAEGFGGWGQVKGVQLESSWQP
ncbi:geranylgeranyl pyrophosphate synthetase [Hypoxylon texense]